MDSQVRIAILRSARQLFLQNGYHGLAMREIAESVGVSKAALYYHFKDKQELFLAILDGYLDQIADILDGIDRSAASSPARIRAFVTQFLALPLEDRAVIRLATQELSQLDAAARQKFEHAYRERFLGRLARIFEEGIRAGDFRPLDSWILTWTLLGMMYPYFFPTQSRSLQLAETSADEFIQIFLYGVSAENRGSGGQ